MIPDSILRKIRDSAYRKYRLGYTIDDIMLGYENDDDFFLVRMKNMFPKEVEEAINKWK